MNLENEKKEASFKTEKEENKNHSRNKQYISLENNKNTAKKNYFRRINKKLISNSNKSPSPNIRPCSTLDSSINFSNINHNTLNGSFIYKDAIITNPNLNTNNQIKINKLKDSKQTFEELNRKFHSLKVEQRRRDRSLSNFSNYKKNKNNYISNNYYTKDIRRNISYSKIVNSISNTMNSLDKNNYSTDKKRKFSFISVDNYHIKKQNIKFNKYLYKNSKKIDLLKIKINAMINNFDKKVTPNKIHFVKALNDTKKYKLYYNYNKSKNKNNNLIYEKDNDIKKFNVFATSKLMDINDIKENNKNNFFDYNYNRNYNKKFNNNNMDLGMYNIKKNITEKKLLNCCVNDYYNNKKINDMLQYLK